MTQHFLTLIESIKMLQSEHSSQTNQPTHSMSHKRQKHRLSEQVDKLIQDYAFGSSLTGFIPIPVMDTLSLISVQRLMLMQMSKLYGIPFSRHLAKTWLSTLMSGVSPQIASPMVGSFLKLIPGIGTLAGGATTAALGGASTYAVGKVFQQHFENGGTFETFDPKKAETAFSTELENGLKKQQTLKQKLTRRPN